MKPIRCVKMAGKGFLPFLTVCQETLNCRTVFLFFKKTQTRREREMERKNERNQGNKRKQGKHG
jgi:hypothetical protein